MTQEQKAKAYDKALERAKELYPTANADQRYVLECLFPELAESEDERIRKHLINCVTRTIPEADAFKEISKEQILAWLEKQGTSYTKRDVDNAFVEGMALAKNELEKQVKSKEYTFKSLPRLLDMIEPSDRAKAYCQKLIGSLVREGYNTDAKIIDGVLKGWNGEDVSMAVMDEKPSGIDNCPLEGSTNTVMTDLKKNQVEPKFHEGEWVVLAAETTLQIVKVDINKRLYWFNDNSYLPIVDEECLRLWTIQDAKNGDVLQLGEVTAIFKKYIGQEKCICYCSVCEGEFEIPIENGEDNIYGCTNTTPATKEQRALLFQKMREAGYEWDAEKKELKLLVTNGGDFESENCEQKSAWSYEDEANLNNIIWLCNNCIKGSETTWIPAQAKKIKHLIETIKERGLLQQNPIEWSEEDETGWTNTMIMIKEVASNHYTKDSVKLVIDWLKSIKQRKKEE